MSKYLKSKLPKTPEEALAHLIKMGFYKPPIVRHVRNALSQIGQQYRDGKR